MRVPSSDELKSGHPRIESEPRTLSEKLPTENHARLVDLLSYLEHLAKLGEKPVFALKEYQSLVFTEEELKGQIGITHDISTDDGHVWLRIERLQRTDPPVPGQELRDWIVISRDPNQQPKIQDVVTRTVTEAEADELVRSGHVSPDDRSVSLKLRDGKQMVDVLLRLEAQPTTKSSVAGYVSTKWTPWAETEKPKRKSIEIYDKFFSLYQALQTEGVERPLEIVWGIGVARWKVRGHVIDHPLIEQLVEIDVAPDSGAITIGPRSAMPEVALKPYFSLELSGADATLSFAKHFFETLPSDLEFSPFQRNTVEPVLRFASNSLDSTGRYHPDNLTDINDRSLPSIAESLVITDTWAIYGRPRSANFLIEDLGRLRKAVTNSPDLPGPSKKLVETPSSETSYLPGLVDITKRTLGGPPSEPVTPNMDPYDEGDQEFFFPKPFNSDQVAIVRRLEEADGVVVQGPPGTGKTHTIANIICHCLATGRRVLVTSKGEAALAVLREHIPEGIRELTISLLTNEREGLKQLERAVALLASTATQISPATLEKLILSSQHQILELKKRLASIDVELSDFAKKHLAKVPHTTNTDGLLPIELAELLTSDADRHSWLPDRLKLEPRFDPLFTEEDIASLREARARLRKDLIYATANIPKLEDLPDGAQIVVLHEDLVKCARIERQIQEGHFPRLHLTSLDAAEKCKALSESIKQVVSAWNIAEDLSWLKPFLTQWLEGPAETERGKLFETLLVAVGDIRKSRVDMLAYAISCPEGAVGDVELGDAIRRAASGERPFGLAPFGKTKVRQLFSTVRIEGRVPNSREDWHKVERYLAWRSKVSSTIVRWNALAAEYGIPRVNSQGEVAARWLSETLDKIDKAKRAAWQGIAGVKQALPALFPHGLDAALVISSPSEAAKAIKVIEANLSAIRYGTWRNLIDSHIQKLKNSSGPIVEELRKFMSRTVGNPNVPTGQISDQ